MRGTIIIGLAAMAALAFLFFSLQKEEAIRLAAIAAAVLVFVAGLLVGSRRVQKSIKDATEVLEIFSAEHGFRAAQPSFEFRYWPAFYSCKGIYRGHEFRVSLVRAHRPSPEYLLKESFEDVVVMVETQLSGKALQFKTADGIKVEDYRIVQHIPGSKLDDAAIIRSLDAISDVIEKGQKRR